MSLRLPVFAAFATAALLAGPLDAYAQRGGGGPGGGGPGRGAAMSGPSVGGFSGRGPSMSSGPSMAGPRSGGVRVGPGPSGVRSGGMRADQGFRSVTPRVDRGVDQGFRSAVPRADSTISRQRADRGRYVDRGQHDGRRHHRRRGSAFLYVAPAYPYASYYYGDCEWLRRRALDTGSGYWWRRYRDCQRGW